MSRSQYETGSNVPSTKKVSNSFSFKMIPLLLCLSGVGCSKLNQGSENCHVQDTVFSYHNGQDSSFSNVIVDVVPQIDSFDTVTDFFESHKSPSTCGRKPFTNEGEKSQ